MIQSAAMPQEHQEHQGLASAEALRRLQQYGPNALTEKSPTPLWRRFLRQFQSPLIYILLFALAVDIAIWVSEGARGLPVEAIAIALILLLNAGLGVYQESKSEAAMARLKEMAASFISQVTVRHQAFSNTKGQRVKGSRVKEDQPWSSL